MTLPSSRQRTEVGVRQLHDQLSRYVQAVQDGTDVIVTLRGKAVAKLTAVEPSDVDPLDALRARGIIGEPTQARSVDDFAEPIHASRPVSDLVSEQRD